MYGKLHQCPVTHVALGVTYVSTLGLNSDVDLSGRDEM